MQDAAEAGLPHHRQEPQGRARQRRLQRKEAQQLPATSTDGVKITILNTKSEIQTQWEELAAEYKDITGVDVEVSVTVGDSPSQDITKRYASGEVPTIFMGDIQDIIMLDEYALDLSNEDWAERWRQRLRLQLQRKTDWFPFLY